MKTQQINNNPSTPVFVVVEGFSMYPTLKDGQKLMLNTSIYQKLK